VENFLTFLGIETSIYAEFIKIIYALEHRWRVRSQKLWLESNYFLVCHYFLDPRVW